MDLFTHIFNAIEILEHHNRGNLSNIRSSIEEGMKDNDQRITSAPESNTVSLM